MKNGRFYHKMPMYFSDFLAISQKDMDEEPGMYHDLLPYLTKVDMVDTSINYDLIRLDNNIPADASICGFAHADGQNTVRFRKGEEEYSAVLSEHEWELYKEYMIVPTYVAYSQDVAYWRKDYELDNQMTEEYQNETDLIHLVIDYLEKSYRLESWRKTFGITENLKGLDVNYAAEVISGDINVDKVWVRTTCIQDIKVILTNIKNFGLTFMKEKRGVIENCGYHAMSEKMAYFARLEQLQVSLDPKNEVLMYHIWY